jgi:hypothetical protein
MHPGAGSNKKQVAMEKCTALTMEDASYIKFYLHRNGKFPTHRILAVEAIPFSVLPRRTACGETRNNEGRKAKQSSSIRHIARVSKTRYAGRLERRAEMIWAQCGHCTVCDSHGDVQTLRIGCFKFDLSEKYHIQCLSQK